MILIPSALPPRVPCVRDHHIHLFHPTHLSNDKDLTSNVMARTAFTFILNLRRGGMWHPTYPGFSRIFVLFVFCNFAFFSSMYVCLCFYDAAFWNWVPLIFLFLILWRCVLFRYFHCYRFEYMYLDNYFFGPLVVWYFVFWHFFALGNFVLVITNCCFYGILFTFFIFWCFCICVVTFSISVFCICIVYVVFLCFGTLVIRFFLYFFIVVQGSGVAAYRRPRPP